jgi:hypothetical protein
MNGRDSYRGTRDDAGSEQQAAKERLNEEYRRFLEKVTERHPDLKGIGKDLR